LGLIGLNSNAISVYTDAKRNIDAVWKRIDTGSTGSEREKKVTSRKRQVLAFRGKKREGKNAEKLGNRSREKP